MMVTVAQFARIDSSTEFKVLQCALDLCYLLVQANCTVTECRLSGWQAFDLCSDDTTNKL